MGVIRGRNRHLPLIQMTRHYLPPKPPIDYCAHDCHPTPHRPIRSVHPMGVIGGGIGTSP